MSCHNVIHLTKFTFMVRKKQIITWAVSIILIMFLYMILFPSVQDIAKAEMDAMPEDLLLLFGIEKMDDIANFSSYFISIYLFVLVGISIFSATFSAGLICKEESTKSIEFLDAHAVSRMEIYLSRVLLAKVSVVLLLLFSFLTTAACGFINGGESFSLESLFFSWFFVSFSALAFGALAFLLAGLSPKLATGGIVSAVVFASYLIGYLGQLLGDKAEFLTYLSPFVILSISERSEFTAEFAVIFMVYIAISVLFVILGSVFYKKRDYYL